MKKAIVLGGTHDHIRLLQLLNLRGYYTILIDYLEDPPAKHFADKHIMESTLNLNRVTEIAHSIKPDLIISACIDQALLTMAFACEQMKLPCHISYQTALELTNKAYMKRKLHENDIPTSRFIVLENATATAHYKFNYPVVIKPADSNSSKGITKVLDEKDVDEAIRYSFSFSRSHKVVIEEFIDGVEFSVDVAVKDYEPHIVMVTKNIKMRQNENNFTIVKSLYPATNDLEVLYQIHDIANKIAIMYDIKNGPMLIQLIYNDENIHVIEFSARIGGGSKHHFIKKIKGFDLLSWFVNSLTGIPEEIKLNSHYNFASVNYIYADNGIINEFVNFDQLLSDGIIEQYFHYKTVGTVVDNHISSSDRPAGYLIVADGIEQFNYKTKIADQHIKILDDNGHDMIIHGLH